MSLREQLMDKKRRLSDKEKRDYTDELEEVLLYSAEETFLELLKNWRIPEAEWGEALNEFRRARDAKRGLLTPKHRTPH